MIDPCVRNPVESSSKIMLIAQEGEGQTIEFKERPVNLDREMVAFANAGGGRIIFGVDDKNQIVTSCGGATDALAILGAMALPALGGAVGVRLGGSTEGSVGRLLPAMVGAGMMLFPGYAFSMSTVGGGSAAANAIGNTLLVVGPPLVLSVADRLFRNTR